MKYTELTKQQEKEAYAFYLHLLNHIEVQNASQNTGIPVCKICGMSAHEIYEDETKVCVLCGVKFTEWGNNPAPLAHKGSCCDKEATFSVVSGGEIVYFCHEHHKRFFRKREIKG
jgi:hypothetical protein